MRVDVGEDRMLQVRLPEGSPTGEIEVLLVLEPLGRQRTIEERRTAAEDGRGALRHLGSSVDELLAERGADEMRREKALQS